MTAVMVQGVSSSAGKSLVTTALARALRRRGVDVVPFKAMNMSNNARVVAGGEIGTAQSLQAVAAGVEPDVRMNPVLVKPEGDTRSQVVVLGRPDSRLSKLCWRERSCHLWPPVAAALQGLLEEHELVLIEGAGSPAEINLRDTDLANMRTAAAADARVLLVADIDRGGAFAHLYGTWALLLDDERRRIAWFVLNKFRGDPSLLDPGPASLRQLTDSLGALRWAREPSELEDAELVVLPGSKHVAADLGWLYRSGLAEEVRRRAARGRAVLGICGGMQMLGDRLDNDGDADGTIGGLGLLGLRTAFEPSKRTERTTVTFAPLAAPWAALSGLEISGYEIRHGRTETTRPATPVLPNGLGYADGPILGIYLHGAFESPTLVRALLGRAPSRPLEQALDELGDAAESHLDLDALLATGAAG